MIVSKLCNKCLQDKPIASFSHNSKGLYGLAQKCKECSAKITAKYREENYSEVYAKKYNTTIEIIDKVISTKVCEICGSIAKGKRRHNIDHCHTTGNIRGLLCDLCNKGLGLFKDDTNLLQNAINYLRGKYGDK